MARQPITFTTRCSRIERQLQALANRFHGDYERADAAFQKLLVDFPTLRLEPDERSKPGAEEYALSVVTAKLFLGKMYVHFSIPSLRSGHTFDAMGC